MEQSSWPAACAFDRRQSSNISLGNGNLRKTSFSQNEKSGGSQCRAPGSIVKTGKVLSPLSNHTYLGEVLGTGQFQQPYSLVSVIADPIKCGYLLAFCESEHSTENLSFIIEVVRFREFLSSDTAAWPFHWQDLDKMHLAHGSSNLPLMKKPLISNISSETFEVSDGDEEESNAAVAVSMLNHDASQHPMLDLCKPQFSSHTMWPSRILKQDIVEAMVTHVWCTYLANDAESQICMPSPVVGNTHARMMQLAVYGPDVFGECLLDPIRTLQRDIFPRFLASYLFVELHERLDSVKVLPSTDMLEIPPLTTSLITSKPLDYFTEKRKFTPDEILHDKYLYVEFRQHLLKSMQVENLLCVRMLEIFHEMCVKNDTECLNQAWLIYRFFVAPGAALEVSLYCRHKKEIMMRLASPTIDMFAELKKSAMNMLTVSFNSYQFTADYRNLYKLMREEKKKFSRQGSSKGLLAAVSSLFVTPTTAAPGTS